MTVPQYMIFSLTMLVLATILGSWLGHKISARAMMMIPLPVAMVVLHVLQYRSGGVESVSHSALGTLASLGILYSWGLSYFFVSQWVDHRVDASSGARALLTALISVVLAVLIRMAFFEPILASLEGSRLAVCLFSVGSIAVAAAVMRRWLGESPPTRGDAPRINYLMRPLSIMLLVILAGELAGRAGDGAFYAGADFLITSFPRLTFELVIASHVAQGARAAQECFYGLSWGLIPRLLWILPMAWLPVLGPELGFGLAGIGLALSWAGNVYLVTRMPRAC